MQTFLASQLSSLFMNASHSEKSQIFSFKSIWPLKKAEAPSHKAVHYRYPINYSKRNTAEKKKIHSFKNISAVGGTCRCVSSITINDWPSETNQEWPDWEKGQSEFLLLIISCKQTPTRIWPITLLSIYHNEEIEKVRGMNAAGLISAIWLVKRLKTQRPIWSFSLSLWHIITFKVNFLLHPPMANELRKWPGCESPLLRLHSFDH